MKRLIALFLILLLLAGCADPDTPSTAPSVQPDTSPSVQPSTSPTVSAVDPDSLFSDRDNDSTATAEPNLLITLQGDSVQSSAPGIQIDGTTVTITREGIYSLTGTLDSGSVIIDAPKDAKIQLILENVSITNPTGAAIYVRQADKTFLTTAENTENRLSNGGSFTAIDENNIDAVIFSKDDLTLNGNGALTIESPAGHGIVSKDELTITSGSYSITTASHGMTGKDSVTISGGSFTIAAGKDGIQADHDEDAALGFVYIGGGTFDITAAGDGISASSALQIDDGSFHILTGGGSENGKQHSSEGWGGMGGGPGGFPGGSRPGGRSSDTTTDTSDDSTSMKGLKAGSHLILNGGAFTLNCADDAAHSNGDLTVTNGVFELQTGDDGFHGEENLTISGGSITITESYEGLEAQHILVAGGTIRLKASDDGLNAAGGMDQSGNGGRDQMFGGGFGGMHAGNGSITISGGSLYINASGDGIDANGTLEITGGHTVVVGPTVGDTATLDYDTSAVISGGTFIGTGASSMMAQTFSDSQNQGVIAVQVGSAPAGTQITLTDSSGKVLIEHTPELSFNIVILSSPDMIKGGSYTITVGTASGTFDAS